MRGSVLALIAAASLAACRESPPETPAGLAQAGVELHRAHEYGKAAELYRRSLALHEDAGVRANLARALAANGRSAEAAEQYRLLLAAEPANGALWHDYGLLLETGMRDLEAAEDALFKATQFPPQQAEANYDLGRVLMQRRRYEEAGACLEAAIQLAAPTAPWLADARERQVQAFLLSKK